MKKWIVLMTALMVAGLAQAVTIKQGTQEIALAGNYDPESADNFNYSLQPGYGHFIYDNVELGLRGLLSGSENASVYGIKGFAEYNFDVAELWAPYLRASLGYIGSTTSLKSDEADDHRDTSALSGAAGVKYFLSTSVAISAEVEYTTAQDKVFVEDDELKYDNVEFNLALRIYLP